MQYFYIIRQGFRTKIGITKDLKERFSTIKRDTGAGFSIWFAQRIFFAERIETLLKRKFKPFLKRHKGSGKNEWFGLNFFQRLYLVFQMALVWALGFYFILIICFCLIFTFLKLI